MKRCYIIAGPNGAGKTTFAKTFLPFEGECLNFINVDLIAEGLSPLDPERARISAGRLLLSRIELCVENGETFSFETTMSGKGYVRRIEHWKSKGYEIVIYFLKLPTVEMAIDRVKLRVSQGGHNVKEIDIVRRFERGLKNFEKLYKNLSDAWVVYDTSGNKPTIIEGASQNE